MEKPGKIDEDFLPNLLPIPKAIPSRVALYYAEIAKNDFLAARTLYQKHLNAQAVYALQQSVEKSAKSFGLMMGILKINDLRSVSHRSVHALLLGMETLTEHMAERVSWLQTSSRFEVEKLRKLGLNSVIHKIAPLVPSPAMVKSDREKIDELDDAEMWHATLNLDINNQYVKSSLRTLENIPFDKASFLFSMRVLKMVGKVMSGDTTGDYFFCILRSSPRAYGLSMLTMWHETATRYPPITSKDYWRMGEYTNDKPLLKRFPFLLKHGKIFCENVYGAALVSTKLNRIT